MPTYLTPGVYVEEIPSASKPIEGVGTAVAAFVGFAPRGPVNTPTLVSNWSQFTATFGDFAAGCYLAHAVYGYFSNGGGNCSIVRVGGDGSASSAAGEITAAPQATLGRYRVAAKPAAIGDGRGIWFGSRSGLIWYYPGGGAAFEAVAKAPFAPVDVAGPCVR